MQRVVLKPALLTLLWAVSIAVFFRFWGVTARVPGLMLWTLLYAAFYVGTAVLGRHHHIESRRRKVVQHVAIWVGLTVVVLAAHTLFPLVRVSAQGVPTVVFVSALDAVIPFWIIGRAMAVVWEPLGLRLLVLSLGGLTVFVCIFAYMMAMPGSSFSGPVPPLSPQERTIREQLQSHVRVLATEIGPRNEGTYEALEQAARYLENAFIEIGYEPRDQWYEYGGQRFRNVEAALDGATRPDEIVVVGGHYDTVADSPGANDNASGTASVLELARLLQSERFGRTIRFVAFVNEEPPFFATRWMGSRQYAARAAERDEKIVAMISMETIGYFKTEPATQHYPPLFSMFYPDRGDFIGFVGNLASRSLVRRCIRVFRETTQLPSEGVAAVEQIPGITWSDQSSFWAHGYKAIMITDTAPFRFPDYHMPTDTAEKLDYDRMARVVAGVAEVLRDLAEPVAEGATDDWRLTIDE